MVLLVLEIILIVLIFCLGGVLFWETREYRKVSKFSQQLEALVTTYSSAFEAVTSALTSLEVRYTQVARDYIAIQEEMIALRTILDIHNKALNLNVDLTRIGKIEIESP